MGWMGCDETYTAKGTSQLSHFRACSGSIERFSPSISRELSPVPIAIGSACYVWATPTQTTSLHDADLGDGPGDSRGAWRSTNRAARDGAVAVPTEKKKRHATGRHRAGLTQQWLPRTGHHLWAFRGTPSPRRSGSG